MLDSSLEVPLALQILLLAPVSRRLRRSSLAVISRACLLAVLLAVSGTSAAAVSVRTLMTVEDSRVRHFLGARVSGAGDVNGDGYDDVIVGAHGADGYGPEAATVYFGGSTFDETAPLALRGGNSSDYPTGPAPSWSSVPSVTGVSVSAAGDVNGDGFGDLIVGSSRNLAGGQAAGRVWIYLGGASPDPEPDLTLTGAPNEALGISVSGAGDINGDGFDDVVIGGFGTRHAYVLFGGSPMDTVPDLTLSPPGASDEFAASMSGAGDVNGDGFDDLLVGAPQGRVSQYEVRGRAYLYFGGRSPDDGADVILNGASTGELYGTSVAGVGDVNGDGFDDVLVGAPRNDLGGTDAGRAYLYFGSPNGLASALVVTGEASGDQFGGSLAGVGDVNGDGLDDFMVAASFHDVSPRGDDGRVCVFLGAEQPDAQPDLVLDGGTLRGCFGSGVAGAGDVTGDGLADLVVGEPGFGGPPYLLGGRAHVFDVYRYLLQAPNGGEQWRVGTLQRVTWRGKDRADLWLSADGGFTYQLLRSNAGGAEMNEIELRVPHAPTRFARVRLTPTGTTTRGDQSEEFFTIDSSVELLTWAVQRMAEGGVELTWSTTPGVGPQGIAGYRLFRAILGATGVAALGVPIGPPLITDTRYRDTEQIPNPVYRLVAVNGLGDELELGRRTMAMNRTPAAWPQPYRGGSMTVAFEIAGAEGVGMAVEIALFDLAGRRVRRLASGAFPSGPRAVAWDGAGSDGRQVPSGVYLLRFVAGTQVHETKVMVIR